MDVQEEIYQAIDNMVGRRLDRQNLTTQSEGIVVGSSVKGDGIYHVKINGNVYKVKDGIGLRPKLNDIVWVCIPNADWGKAYICAGKRFDGGEPPVENYVQANPDSLATDTLRKLKVNKTTYEIPRDVRDVQQNGTSVVENHIANIRAPRDVVDEQGHSLINEFNQAVIPTVASGVNDVLVDGTSVVTNHTASITMPTIPVIDVKVNNTSVVSGRIANVTVPTIEANPSQSATSTLTKLKVNNTVYAVPSGGGGGSTVTVTPILTSGTKIATIDVDSADFDLYAPDGDTVEWTGTLTTGTEIGRLTINGSENIIYAPAGGSGSGDVVDVYVNGKSVLDSDNIAQIDLSGYQTNLQSEIDRIYNVCVSMGSTPPSHGFADVLLTALYTIGGGKKYVDIDSTSTTNMRYFGHAKEVD